MLKNIYIFSAIIIVLLTMLAITSLAKHPHSNEVLTDNFHGFIVYTPRLKNTTELTAKDLNSKILEFESIAYNFIYKQLTDRSNCREKILDNFHKYKRYYRVNSQPSVLFFDTTFTHENRYELYDHSIEEELMIQDGGSSQFHLTYDFNEKVVTQFAINGPECFYIFRISN